MNSHVNRSEISIQRENVHSLMASQSVGEAVTEVERISQPRFSGNSSLLDAGSDKTDSAGQNLRFELGVTNRLPVAKDDQSLGKIHRAHDCRAPMGLKLLGGPLSMGLGKDNG